MVGEEFTLAEVAAALQLDNDVVDQRCERLVGQRQLLQLGEPERWPDGTVTIRARFGHALYRHAIYDRLPPTRKLVWHGRIGARKAGAFRGHTGPIAAELATHFARAGNAQEAVRYHVDAGQVALRQQAHHVAVAQYTAGLEQLAHLPDTPARAEQEIGLQVALGVAQMATKGYGAPAPAAPCGLSEREVEVLGLVAHGMTNKEIAAKLFLSAKTVQHHVAHIYDKIDRRTRAGAAMFAMEHRLVSA